MKKHWPSYPGLPGKFGHWVTIICTDVSQDPNELHVVNLLI